MNLRSGKIINQSFGYDRENIIMTRTRATAMNSRVQHPMKLRSSKLTQLPAAINPKFVSYDEWFVVWFIARMDKYSEEIYTIKNTETQMIDGCRIVNEICAFVLEHIDYIKTLPELAVSLYAFAQACKYLVKVITAELYENLSKYSIHDRNFMGFVRKDLMLVYTLCNT